MFLKWTHPSIRLTGRWTPYNEALGDVSAFLQQDNHSTSTTAAGSSLEIAFSGRMAELHFDLRYRNTQPMPHVWLQVDGGARVEAALDRILRVDAGCEGTHVVRLVYKSAMEVLHRWYLPLQGVVSFMGAEVDAPADLPADDRPLIEFVGDSITEGVLTDALYGDEVDFVTQQWRRPNDDDNTATYASLLAEKLNLRPMYQGYGAVGVTRGGCGSVPRAALIYPYVIDGVPYKGDVPDVIMINHGANDRGNGAAMYREGYLELLDVIRGMRPHALIICLSAFCGGFNTELKDIVDEFNRTRGDQVKYISSFGWVPEEPLHPLRDGHRTIADHLAPIVAGLLDEAGIAHS